MSTQIESVMTHHSEQWTQLALERQQEMRRVAATASLLRTSGANKTTPSQPLRWSRLRSTIKSLVAPGALAGKAA